jgi:hypothetical protein
VSAQSTDVRETLEHLLALGMEEFLRTFLTEMVSEPESPESVETALNALQKALTTLLEPLPHGRAALHAFALDLIESTRSE